MYRIGQAEIDELTKVIKGGTLFRVNKKYREVETFEKEWAATIGAEYALCVNGGTSALIGGLVGLGIGPGDEVLVPGYTFMATAVAVLAVGAIPVITEVDDTLTLDPDDVEKKISRHTRAMIPVHMVGLPANLEKLKRIAGQHHLKILEDACQADGGSYQHKRLGSWGDAGAFSFNDFKILSAGDAGCMVTDDRTVYERALIYHDGGAAFRPYAEEIATPMFTGVQNRVGELTGAVLRMQLQRLEGILTDLRAAKKQWLDAFQNVANIIPARCNDPAGEWATTLALQFNDEPAARKFATTPGVSGGLPIDTGRHVYVNWTPILEKRGAHHPSLNPFNMPENKGLQMDYSIEMCPQTLDILKRTVYIKMDPDAGRSQNEQHIETCLKAAKEI